MDAEQRIRAIGFDRAMVKMAEQEKEAGPLQLIQKALAKNLIGKSPRLHNIGLRAQSKLTSSATKARNIAGRKARDATRLRQYRKARVVDLAGAPKTPQNISALRRAESTARRQQAVAGKRSAGLAKTQKTLDKTWQAPWTRLRADKTPVYKGPRGTEVSPRQFHRATDKATGSALQAPWDKAMGGERTLVSRIFSKALKKPNVAPGTTPKPKYNTLLERVFKPKTRPEVPRGPDWVPSKNPLLKRDPAFDAKWAKMRADNHAKRVAMGLATPSGTGKAIAYAPGKKPPFLGPFGKKAPRVTSPEAATRQVAGPPAFNESVTNVVPPPKDLLAV